MALNPRSSAKASSLSTTSGLKYSFPHISTGVPPYEGIYTHPTGHGCEAYHSLAFSSLHFSPTFEAQLAQASAIARKVSSLGIFISYYVLHASFDAAPGYSFVIQALPRQRPSSHPAKSLLRHRHPTMDIIVYNPNQTQWCKAGRIDH